tara:strand:- start:1050 stop:2402 length:1353 start_codon:yes stop_codon:yes gene_type:complete
MANNLINQDARDYYTSPELYGSYQFTPLETIIDQFMISYVGEDKIIPKIKRQNVKFHAMRGMQEFSFDVFKSFKGEEIVVPPSLQMVLPQDYVNYTKLSSIDSHGVKHIIYPTSKNSNPKNPYQNSAGEYKLTAAANLVIGSPTFALDGEYTHIRTGMFMVGVGVAGTATVYATSTENGVTTITIDGTGSNVVHVGNRTVEFFDSSGALELNQDTVVLSGVTWSVTAPDQRTLTAASAGDAAKVRVGSIASHDDFPFSVKVVDVQDDKILLSSFVSSIAGSGGNVTFISNETTSETWKKYKNNTNSTARSDSYEYDVWWRFGDERYGLDPQSTQINGSFYIDQLNGKIHFSADLVGKSVVLDYISDGVGYDNDNGKASDGFQVHKFAEEAMYKYIAHSILSTSRGVPEYLVMRFKKEKYAETRKAKLRLSNIKLEEITQILRGKSKQIKH